jgi:hypothetical protein
VLLDLLANSGANRVIGAIPVLMASMGRLNGNANPANTFWPTRSPLLSVFRLETTLKPIMVGAGTVTLNPLLVPGLEPAAEAWIVYPMPTRLIVNPEKFVSALVFTNVRSHSRELR